jgi:hypothetical protein
MPVQQVNAASSQLMSSNMPVGLFYRGYDRDIRIPPRCLAVAANWEETVTLDSPSPASVARWKRRQRILEFELLSCGFRHEEH